MNDDPYRMRRSWQPSVVDQGFPWYLSSMATKLAKPLKREILIGSQPYVITLDPDGLKLTEKGRRKGIQLAWKDLLSGQAALSAALNASLADG